MQDKYGVDGDPDCYPNSSTLINLLDITDPHLLSIAERDISALAAQSLEFAPPPYNLTYLQHIHKKLFEDIYEWAGTIRRVDISKGGTRFCTTHRIEAEATKLFAAVEKEQYFASLERTELIYKVSEFYGEINMLHPFRDGNGRAQRIMFEHLIVNAGFEISWSGVEVDEWIEANISAVACDYEPLACIFDRCIGDELR